MEQLLKYAKSVVRHITGTGIGQRTRTFLQGVAWISSGALVARLLSGVVSLWAARHLGPAAFGEVSLALAASMWIQVPLFLGMPTALMHYLPRVDPHEQPLWSVTGLGVLSICASITLLCAFIFQHLFMNWLGVSQHIFHWTLIWCLGFVIYTASMTWVNADEKFSKRAGMEVAFTVLLLLFVGYFGILKEFRAANYILSYSMAYALVGIWGLYAGRDRLKISSFDSTRVRQISRQLLGYGFIAAMGSTVSALFMASGRLMANQYLSSKEVGLLAVYQAGSIQTGSYILSIGSQVFFPIASRTPNKMILMRKINHVILITMIPCLISLMSLLALYFKLLGKNYPYDLTHACIYTMAAYLSFVFGVLSWYYAAIGRQGILTQTLVGFVAGGINLLACWILIPRFHILGAGGAYVLSTGLGIIMLYLPIIQRRSGLET